MLFLNLYINLLHLNRFRSLFILFACIFVSACNNPPPDKKEEKVVIAKPENVDEEVSRLISKHLSGHDTSLAFVLEADTLVAVRELKEFYSQNNYNVTWTEKGILTKQGDSLIDILRSADQYGLYSNDYHFDKITGSLEASKSQKKNKFDAAKLYEADLFLTDAFFKFAVHLSKGRLNSDSLTAEWHPEKLDTNLVELLKNAIIKNNIRGTLDSLEPRNEQYKSLKKALREFKAEFNGIEWESLASRESDSVTYNDRLKKRLQASHNYCQVCSGSDSIKLIKSIKDLQCRYNLVQDGKIGKLTFKALQQTKQDMIEQIEMNMERWRWTDAPKEKRYVWVNIPKYEMHVMEHDTLVMRSRVIVGAPKTRTPLLKSTIRYFIIYPYWTVPFSIITKEILPQLKRDTSYLRRKNFEVLDRNGYVIDTMINWKKYSKNYFPFRIRQRIGEDNSLGILKFNFNNKYGVYMHDTDNRRLFGRETRALSHGCVRLEKFYDFAKFLIREDSIHYPVDSLNADLLVQEQKQINVKKPIAIYINYYTVEVDEYNELHFFTDIYMRDEKMLKALKKN
jgi:murein L,D-transpeptidase YcbB/YkuD